jgi:hypothetical protein
MPADANPRQPALRIYNALIVMASVAIPVILLARVVLNFKNQYFLTHVEGAWLACAYDFIHGVFYRPLFGPLGYGGTRYFPLYFVLTGLLSKPFGSLETAGIALSGLCVVLALAAVFVLLRRMNVSVLLSVAGMIAILSVASTQQALLGAKGDSLAAAANLWGIVVCINSKFRRGAIYLAAGLFTLAFATKVTTVFGVAAIVLAWMLSRRTREAVQLAIATAIGYAAVLGVMYAASGGRVFAIFRACAVGGGSLSYTLQAPVHLLSKALDVDPVFLLFLMPAIVFGLHYLLKDKSDLLPIYFSLVLVVTTVIFGSLGIGINHLFDLQIAAVLVLIVAISRSADFAEVGTGILAVALVISIVPTLQGFHGDLTRASFCNDAEEVLLHLKSDTRPILAENPLVVLKSGKSPYLLDPFMFRILATKQPDIAADLWEKIKHQGFAAIVLQRDPASAEGKDWYTNTHFGGEFLRDLDANYAYSFAAGNIIVYEPKAVQQ